MKTVAFIPVRGASKSIKDKNIKEIGSHPLVYWVVSACAKAKNVDKIFVSTDSDKIKTVVNNFGFKNVEVISRSPETALDSATSESALLEFSQNYDFEKIIFLQATSPLTRAEDIDGAIKKFETEKTDSLISVVKNYQFLWTIDGTPLNYDPKNRPRRQDWDGYYIENGAFYISTRKAILDSECRISGNISFWEMSSKTLYELDEPADWKIIESIGL